MKIYNSMNVKQLPLLATLFTLLALSTIAFAQPNVPNWKINRWKKAGVIGGVPSIPSSFGNWNSVTVTNKTNAGIQSAINTAKSNNKKYVYLPNGNYTLTGQVNLVSGVSLVGQSRSGVKVYIKFNTGVGFSMYNDNNCGIYRMTINGRFPKGNGQFHVTPSNKWGCPNCNELPNVTNISVKINKSNNCWIDNVTINNSGRHPIVLGGTATHCTVRNTAVKGAFNKGGGANGYFFIMGKDNLITKCTATQIRHFTIQARSAEWNVVYDNNFQQEISFHAEDNGNNLIEKNKITLPSDMPTRYYAIMGTWSTDHKKSIKENYLFQNNCIENNHNGARLFGGQYGSNATVFAGPLDGKKEAVQANRTYDHKKNFKSKYKKPSGGKLYKGSSSSRLAQSPEGLNSIKVYPNPASRVINIDLPTELKNARVKLVNMVGCEVYSAQGLNSLEETITIKLGTDINDGLYVLIVEDGINQYLSKVTIAQQ